MTSLTEMMPGDPAKSLRLNFLITVQGFKFSFTINITSLGGHMINDVAYHVTLILTVQC